MCRGSPADRKNEFRYPSYGTAVTGGLQLARDGDGGEKVLTSGTDEELASANQRIDDMSFKDLTARAAAAMKPKPAETAKTPAKVKHALKWLREKAGGEWVQLFVSDVFTLYRERQQLGPLLKELNSDTELKKMARELRDVMLS